MPQAVTQKEQQRLHAMCVIEREYWQAQRSVAGVDEAGRGPLAGPVTAACVWMPQTPLVAGVNDSKRLSEAKREALFGEIVCAAVAYGVGWASEAEIEALNILGATKLACARAFAQMPVKPEVLLTDALSGLNICVEQRSIVHGDALSYSIAAASILAKVSRDRFMRELDEKHPEYGFAAHKGYGTAKHIAAIKQYGPCDAHRALFIRKFVEK